MTSSESHQLADWLQRLGCPVQLSTANLRRLTAPNMRSVWRHLRDNVISVQNVQTIRKNLLLANLKEQESYPFELGTVTVHSIQEYSQIKILTSLQKEIDSEKEKIKTVDHNLKSVMRTLAVNNSDKCRLRDSITEEKKKTSLLKQKLLCTLKDNNKLGEEKVSANFLVLHKTLNSPNTFSSKNVAKALLDDNKSFDLFEMVWHLPSHSILNGIIFASKDIYQKLHRYRASFITEQDLLFEDELSNHNGVSYYKHLDRLNLLLMQNQLLLNCCHKKLTESRVSLLEEKEKLVNLIENLEVHFTSCHFDEDVSASEFCSKLVEALTLENKSQKLKLLKEQLDIECLEFDDLRMSADDIYSKGTELQELVEKKVCHINKLCASVYSNKVKSSKEMYSKRCVEEVSKVFAAHLKANEESHEDELDADENIFHTEIEVFQGSPLAALTRSWEGTTELLPKYLLQQEFSNNPQLVCLFLQSEPHIILKSVFEKRCWSLINKNIINGLM